MIKIEENNKKSHIIELANQADTWIDFVDLLTDEGYNIKEGDLEDIGIVDVDTAEEFFKEYGEPQVWKEYPHNINEINVSSDVRLDNIKIKYDNSISGDLRVVRDIFKFSDQFKDKIMRYGVDSREIKEMIMHEIGHLLHEKSSSMREWIDKNPEGALGRYNLKDKYFEGISYNKTESFAQAFALYFIRPNDLKSNFPKAYKFLDEVVSQLNIDIDEIYEFFQKVYTSVEKEG